MISASGASCSSWFESMVFEMLKGDMDGSLEKLKDYVDAIESIRETILTNIVLIGQEPAPTFQEQRRIQVFLDRMAELQVDECTTDGYHNPIGIVHGTSPNQPPIFVVAHLDTFSDSDAEPHYTVGENQITGPGVTDNSVGVGVLLSLPMIFRHLNVRFQSDIVLAGVIQSIGRGNLRGIRHLLKTWATPIRGAVCIEGVELGRLNYYADGMIRAEIGCNTEPEKKGSFRFRPNAILVINEIINHILGLRLPQRPPTRVIFGRISGGVKHGDIARSARLGFEIQSKSDDMVRAVYNEIRDIVAGARHEYGVDLVLKTISNIHAARMRYNHPLVKQVSRIMKELGIQTVSSHSESELSIFLSRKIPAVTLGVTRGKNYHREDASMEISPMAAGIAQIVGAIMAIDSGACDDTGLD